MNSAAHLSKRIGSVSAVRPWAYAGRAVYGGHARYSVGHRLESADFVAVQAAPNRSKGWELYVLDGAGLELFAGYAPARDRELLDNALVALLDARSGEPRAAEVSP